jgi:CDP-glucose 4,6-dehydratase
METVVNNYFNCYQDKKVFVTGHTGFKGAWLITWLHQLGAHVKGYALPPKHATDLFNIISPNLVFENTFGDILDKKKLASAITDFKPDFIFHLAAQALVRRSYEIPAETFDVNTIGTANVLEAVRELSGKCTIIVVTTDKVYENREVDHLYSEDDILGGYDPYSASKAAAEIVVSAMRNSFFNVKDYGTHQKTVVSARAGNVIGGGDFSKDRIIPDIIHALKNQQPVAVRNPNAVRPWQHVLEPLSGYLLVAAMADENVKKLSASYNFGPLPDDHLPVNSLVDIAINCWGSGSWTGGSNKNDVHEAGLLKLSISKAQKELNWNPKLSSSQAIDWTVNWYKAESDDKFKYTLQQIESYQQK